jgi:hypothetical protein
MAVAVAVAAGGAEAGGEGKERGGRPIQSKVQSFSHATPARIAPRAPSLNARRRYRCAATHTSYTHVCVSSSLEAVAAAKSSFSTPAHLRAHAVTRRHNQSVRVQECYAYMCLVGGFEAEGAREVAKYADRQTGKKCRSHFVKLSFFRREKATRAASAPGPDGTLPHSLFKTNRDA